MKMSAYYKDVDGVLHRIDTDSPVGELEDTRNYIRMSLYENSWHTGEIVASPVLVLLQGGAA